MKKVITVLTMMIIMVCMNVSLADYVGDYIWFPEVVNDFEFAFDNNELGDSFHSYALHDGILYWGDIAELHAEDWGCDPDPENLLIRDLKDNLETAMHEEGLKHAKVWLRTVGKAPGGEFLYEVEIYTMYNLNDFRGEKCGSGYVKDGIEYNAIKGICYIR